MMSSLLAFRLDDSDAEAYRHLRAFNERFQLLIDHVTVENWLSLR